MAYSRIAKLQQTVSGGAIIFGIASILSRVLGLVRDRLLSSHFGASSIADSYFTAFKIPDFIFNIIVLGALSASFVPIFIEYWKKKGHDEAMRMAVILLNLIAVILIIVGVVCFIFTPQLMHVLAYGDTAEQQSTTILFTRIMLVSIIFFGMSNVLSGILHAHKKFLIYALAPIFYNVGIICGILFFVPLFGPVGLPFGVVFGSFLHFAIQLPALFRTGFHYRPILFLKHPGVTQVIRLMPSRSFALGLTQLNTMCIFAIASTLGDGARATWQYADNLQQFPINIFGVSLALAVFPFFSEAYAENNMERFKQVFSENFRRILFFVIPISIITLLLRAQIVRVVYGAGVFDWEATYYTAQTLGVFALSMFAQSLIPLLSRSFFARQDTKTPVIISAISVIVNVVCAFVFAKHLGIIGLAFAFSLSSIVAMLLLLATLRVRQGDLDDDRIISSTWKIIGAALLMGLVVHGLKYVAAPLVNMQTFVGVFLQTTIAASGGIMVYIVIAKQFGFVEAQSIWNRFVSFRHILRKGNHK
ncbi:MAG TPA: murein biosynthesis integral membrane protein MurJ [Patescibacteria group bacterium]|nr:murein biosynthesis integral membrane protein MurJ [Patescibacteria group bacterium]